MPDVPLERVNGWSPDQIARAKAAWMTTAEQIVAVAATDGGLQTLSEQLRVSKDEARRLVDLAKHALPETTRAEMDRPADTSNYGLGVHKPRSTDHDH